MAKTGKLGVESLETFAIWKDDGITKHPGLVQANFAVTVYVNGVVVSRPFSISEIGGLGEYLLRFTPDVLGTWKIEIRFVGLLGVPAQVYETDDVQVFRSDIDDAAQTIPGGTEIMIFRALYPTGDPVPNAGLMLRDSHGDRLHSGFLDFNGEARITMPIGTGYTVTMNRQDLQFDPRTFNVVAGGGTVTVTGKTPPAVVIGK